MAACVALAFAAPAYAQELQFEEASPALTKPQKSVSAAEATYIVRLKGNPAVAYDGEVAGLKATRPGKGRKIDPESKAVMDYAAYLQSRHDAVVAKAAGKKVHSYVYTFNGFAAKLNAKQAQALKSDPDVLSVWKDEALHLETSYTPNFLGLTGTGGLWSQVGGQGAAGENVIIGMVDSGFWPENPSFSDRDAEGKLVYQNIPHWPGKCHPAEAFNASNCNQKVIGARWYNGGWGATPEAAAAAVKAKYPNDFNSPRDGGSHGSHTASTAGGNAGVDANVGITQYGKISGMAPRARLSIYKTCYGDGSTSLCWSSDSVAAIDQAVADGVDILNYSISGSRTSSVDAVSVAFLFAVDAGVFVAASAGNDGPTVSTVNHNAPWLTTVAASTHDRIYASGITLGNGASYFGVSAGPGLASAATVLSENAGAAGMPADQIAQCWSNNTGGGLNPPTGPEGNRLDPAKVAGKIVVCDRGGNARVDKSDAVKAAGGIGMILVNVTPGTLDSDSHVVPSVHLQSTDRAAVRTYVTSAAAAATASLQSGTPMSGFALGTFAPDVAGFSSRGPGGIGSIGDLIKPDIMAPGVAVLAAVSPVTPTNFGKNFDLFQGTSMASPHIAGIAALFKQRFPTWSPAMIKSAMMTTASRTRTNGSAIAGGAFDYGAGQVVPTAATNPGLVYDANFTNWLNYLCGTGEASGCGANVDPSDLNYPSIGIGAMTGFQTVKRTVTNVGGKASTYKVAITPPAGMTAVVNPTEFTVGPGGTADYTVTFTRNITGTTGLNAFAQGSLTWSDTDGHSVRSPIAVRPVALSSPAEVAGNGAAFSYPISFGFTGGYTMLRRGLVPATLTPGTVTDDPTDDFLGMGNPGTTEITFVVPAGTTYARWALFNDAMEAPQDLDLYLYEIPAAPAAPILRAISGGTTSNEVVSQNYVNAIAAPRTYKLIVHGFETNGGAPANFTVFSWNIGAAATANWSATFPASATLGTTGNVNLSFTGLAPNTRYLGTNLHVQLPGSLVGNTVVSVRTP